MNITKAKKTQPDLIHQSKTSKSFLVISTNYQLEKLYSILKKTPSLVNSKDQKNETFLSYALKRKNEEIAELILTSPILDISYQDKNGNSYLHIAVINQLENIVRILINKGINVNMQNNDGNTALHFAYSIHDIKFISIIIENSGDLNIKNNKGLRPEEIKKDSFDEIIDNNYICLNRSNTQNNNNGIIEDYYKLKIDGENGKNDSIIMGWESIGMKDNEYNNTKNNLKYSLVNFSYSEDNNNDENEEEEEEEKEKENSINQAKKDSNQNSDIFDLTSSLTYKEKIASISVINSHVVADPIFASKYDKDDSINDIVNLKKLKTNENKLFHNSLINNSDMNNLYKKESSKAFSESIKKNPKFIAKIANCNGFDNGNYLNNIKDFDITNSINKENKEKINNGEENNLKANNINNVNNYLKNFNEDFAFSPLNTIADSLNNKKNIIEVKINKDNNNSNKKSDFIYSNINKNLNLGNHPIFKKNQIKKRINFTNINNNNNNNNNNSDNQNMISNSNITDNTTINIDDSLMDSHPKILNSKSNVDIYSSEMTADNSNNYKNLYQNSMKHSHESLLIFLSEIKLEKYYNIMNSNGFEDIQLLIDEIKSGIGVTDSQLKEAGIDLPGDRAKILIRLQEKAGNFAFQIPKKVYYMLNDLDNYDNDFHIKEIKAWLKELKVENYLENFVNGGYYSLELMMMQMETKNPINDKILKDDLGIKKIGHRARIINELTEEGKRFHNKLKASMISLGNVETKKICDCILF